MDNPVGSGLRGVMSSMCTSSVIIAPDSMSSQESSQSSCGAGQTTQLMEPMVEGPVSGSSDEKEVQSKAAFTVDTSKISTVPSSEQADELRDLGLVVFNQNEFEEGNGLVVFCLR